MNPETQVPRVRVSDVGRHEGETVEIAGWLYNLRRSGKICFPQVRDGSGVIQCVAVKSALPEELFESLKDLTQESSLIIRGKVRAEARALRLVREQITLCRRDISKMIATAIEEGVSPAALRDYRDWTQAHLAFRSILARIPRTATQAELAPIAPAKRLAEHGVHKNSQLRRVLMNF